MSLPIVTEQMREETESQFQADDKAWKKRMVHQIKEDNPEVNTLLLQLAEKSTDPKSVIIAGYMVYQVLEMALAQEEQETSFLLEE